MIRGAAAAKLESSLARSRSLRSAGVLSPRRLLVYNPRNQVVIVSDLEIAATHFRRFVGLAGLTRNWARPGRGLWIKPSIGIHTFGMLFPIDVIFLDEALHVIHLQENLPPFRISAVRLAARSVLELPACTIRTTSTRAGDQLEIVLMDGSERSTGNEVVR